MISSIVFDMGQVLLRFDPPEIARRAGVPELDAPLFLREVFTGVEWIRMDRARMEPEEALERVCARLPRRLWPQARRALFGWWELDFRPVEGMEALMAELKANGYRLCLLSNATRALHDYGPRIPGWQYFDGCVISADWQILKPQHGLYEILFRTCGLRPEECFFIDDNHMNIEAALELGMSGTVFYGDILRLRRDLCAAGVRVRTAAAQ